MKPKPKSPARARTRKPRCPARESVAKAGRNAVGSKISLDCLATDINLKHAQVLRASNTAFERAIECGELLLKAKKLVPHGEWADWISRYTKLSQRTCASYMQLARMEPENRRRVADLGVRRALASVARSRSAVDGTLHPGEARPTPEKCYLSFVANADPTPALVPAHVVVRCVPADSGSDDGLLAAELRSLRREEPYRAQQSEIDAVRRAAVELRREADEMAAKAHTMEIKLDAALRDELARRRPLPLANGAAVPRESRQ